MEAIYVLIIVVFIIFLYFSFGIVMKLIWGWAPLAVGIFLCLTLVVNGGWAKSILGIFIAIFSLVVTESWQSTSMHQKIEKRIESMFYFKD